MHSTPPPSRGQRTDPSLHICPSPTQSARHAAALGYSPNDPDQQVAGTHMSLGRVLGMYGPTTGKFYTKHAARSYTPAVARRHVQEAMKEKVASLSRSFNPMAAAAAFSGGSKTRTEALSDMFGDHDTFNAQTQILTIEDEFTEHERMTGAQPFPSSTYIASTMKNTYGRYKDELTNKVLYLAAQDNITRKASSVFKPDGFNPHFEYCPLAVLVEQVLHCVRREAKHFILGGHTAPDQRDSGEVMAQLTFKAKTYPQAMFAIRRIIAFCMMYPMPAQFRLISLLGSRLVMANEPELDIVAIVDASAKEVTLETLHSRTRPGFNASSESYRLQFPAMKQKATKEQKGKPRRGRGHRGSQPKPAAPASAAHGRGRHHDHPRGRGAFSPARGANNPRGRGARGRGARGHGRGM